MQHHKIHILRQYRGRSATSVRALADRYGVSKAELSNILEVSRTTSTSSLHITFDFFKTTSANLEVKEETVSSKEKVGISLKEKEEDASLAGEEKWMNASLEREEEQLKEMKKEPVSWLQEETGIPAVSQNNMKTAAEDCVLAERLKNSLHDTTPLRPSPGRVLDEVGGELGLSRQELTTTLLTLQQVVESCSHMPRWFTFIFDSIFPGLNHHEEDAWSGVQWAGRDTVSLPPRQNILSAVLVLRQVLQNDRQLPAWFNFTLSRVLQKYRSRRRQASQGSRFSEGRGSVPTSPFAWTWCYESAAWPRGVRNIK